MKIKNDFDYVGSGEAKFRRKEKVARDSHVFDYPIGHCGEEKVSHMYLNKSGSENSTLQQILDKTNFHCVEIRQGLNKQIFPSI